MLQPPRRTDTPPRTKSPSFSLFPATQASKASKVLGTNNLPLNPSPLARPRTASPLANEEKAPEEKPEETNKQDSLVVMVRSPPLQMPHRPQFPERSSSITSISSVQSEKIFAHDTPAQFGLPIHPRPLFPERSSSFAFGQGDESMQPGKPPDTNTQAASQIPVKKQTAAMGVEVEQEKAQPAVSGPDVYKPEHNPSSSTSETQIQQPKKRKHKPKPPSLNLVSSNNPQPKPQLKKTAAQAQDIESPVDRQKPPTRAQSKQESKAHPPLCLAPGHKAEPRPEQQSQRHPQPQPQPQSDKPTAAKVPPIPIPPSQTTSEQPASNQTNPEPNHTHSEGKPQIEVSTARSISLSKKSAQKQVMVPRNRKTDPHRQADPLGKVETLRPEEKLIQQKQTAKTPQVMEGGGQHGHRHVKSQGVVIESV